MIKYYLILILLIGDAFGEIYFINPSATRGKNVFDSRLDIRRFNTENLFDTSGNKTPLPPGNSFQMSNIDLNLIYGLSDDLDLNLGIRGRQNQAQVGSQSYSNSGFESFWITGKYSLSNSSKFTSSIELLFRSTFYSNNNQIVQSQELIMGDAGNEEALFLNGGYKISNKYFLFGRAAINWPENVLSTEVLYDLKFSSLLEPIRLDIGVGGTISLYKSPYPSLEAARDAFNLNTGGSNLFVSWNRQATIPYLELSYLSENFNFGLNLSAIVAGKSTDNGVFAGLYIAYHVGAFKEPFKGFNYGYSDFKLLGKVSDIGPKMENIKISFGTSDDLEIGDDIYFFKEISNHKEILMAKGKVKEVGVNWSIIVVSEKLNKISLDDSLLAKILYKKN